MNWLVPPVDLIGRSIRHAMVFKLEDVYWSLFGSWLTFELTLSLMAYIWLVLCMHNVTFLTKRGC